jgi:NADP-dependent 3-hydroxy acid dehydrogenase YdfG
MYTNRRLFDWQGQELFARVSSDFNPIHLDAVAARRTYSGAPIVHGIHSLLWTLDCAASSGLAVAGVNSLKAQFLQPIYVGDEAVVEISQPAPALLRARVLVGSEEVLAVSLGLNDARAFAAVRTGGDCIVPPAHPANLALADMAGLKGCLQFGPAIAELDAMFPRASAAFGGLRIAALASTSCLVGMVVPGLNSMYSGLEASFCADSAAPAKALLFSVESIVARFRLVRIAVAAQGLRGSLETVSRMPPVRQIGIEQLRSVVSADEFRDCVALIVGGSRGLGELTAKLIAAGGGRVVLTYASGKLEADALARELADLGASCACLPYDVRRPAAEQLRMLEAAPTHLYYFATPSIFRRKAGLFDEQRFAEFNDFYIRGFFDLVQTCSRASSRGLRVFYPSSTALDERPATMTEYTMSKAAAEVLCADLTKFASGTHVIVRRLPRLPTDQTNSVVPAKTLDAVEVLLPIVREMHMRDTQRAVS